MKRSVCLGILVTVLAFGMVSESQAQWRSGYYGGYGYRSGVSVSIGFGGPVYRSYPPAFYGGYYSGVHRGYYPPVRTYVRPVYAVPVRRVYYGGCRY